MNPTSLIHRGLCPLLAAALSFLFAASAHAQADIPGIPGPSFTLAADSFYIDTPDGDSVLMWGCADTGGGTAAQYPCPTLIVNEGDTVTVALTNNLPEATSLVFPGQGVVGTTGGSPGLLTAEAASGGGTVSYSFTASNPGTYMYHSGTNTALQVEMGVLGAIIVRPAGFGPGTSRTAYGHADTAYDHEYLYLLTEMDVFVHDLVDFGYGAFVDLAMYDVTHWFINGRNAPDTMQPHGYAITPHQPYGAMAQTHPGEKVLLRMIGGSRKQHPFHPHGNHSLIVARDGRMVSTNPGAGAAGPGPDLGTEDFTYNVLPGGTFDTIFDWTGEKLGWDIYGHSSGDPLEPNEYAPDHGIPLPVTLPGLQDLSLGGFYSGSAFLGSFGALPPGEGGLNLNGGLTFIWHSHDNKELINNDIFPGGMMTQMIIEPHSVPIPSFPACQAGEPNCP